MLMRLATLALVLLVVAVPSVLAAQSIQRAFRWKVHDMDRPQPPVVDPGPAPAPSLPPSDAVVLFGPGRPDLSAWRSGDAPAKWVVRDGAFIVEPGTGDIRTAEEFGDVQMRIEWMIPADRAVDGQQGGNSGVFFLDRYELQILASHGNRTYADGMAGALYGQFPPMVNATRPNGQWNVYDIVFRGPVFGADGSLVAPATVTAFLNGVLVQDHAELLGATVHGARAVYQAHGAKGPIRLQDHGDPIRFRNVWVRPLPPRPEAE
jgi:hypothetical protein